MPVHNYNTHRFFMLFSFVLALCAVVSAAEKPALEKEQELFLKDATDELKTLFLEKALAEPESAYGYLLRAQRIRLPFLADPQTGRAGLQKIIESEKITGKAKTLAMRMQHDLAMAAGEWGKAQVLAKDCGTVPAWYIAGPFGKYGPGDFFNPFAPESSVDLQAVMRGSGRKVKWRPVDPEISLNYFHPWGNISPRRGVVYLFTAFKLPSESACVLDIKTLASVRAWVDGTEVANPALRSERELPDSFVLQTAKGSKLGAGWHTVLFKLYAESTGTEFLCSLTGESGKSIDGVEYLQPGQQLPEIAAGKSASLNFDYGGYESKLEPGWEGYSAKMCAWRAAVLQAQDVYDLSHFYWQKAAQLDPKNPYYLSSLGEAQRLSAFMPQSKRDTLSRRSHQKALELYPDSVISMLSLAEYEAGRKRFKAAGDLYSRAVKANPRAIRVLVSRARMAVENKWDMESGIWLDELAKACPDCMGLPLLQAKRSGKPGGLQDTAKYVQQAWLKDRSEYLLALQAVNSYFKSGLKSDAQKLLTQLAPWQQKLPEVLSARGRMLLAQGKGDEARELFVQASDFLDGDAASLWAAAQAAVLPDDTDAVKQYLEQSLKLDPGQHQARRLLDELSGKDYEFWKKYAINGMKTIRDFQSDSKPSGSTARLIDQTVMTIYPDGSYSNYTHEMQAVLNSSGVSQAAVVDTYGELLEARTILPKNGLTLEPVLLPGENRITMPAISPGAYTEHAYLLQMPAADDLTLSFPIWFFRSPDSEEAFLLSQYIIRVPKGMAFSYAASNLGEDVEFEQKDEKDGFHTYIWTGRDMPRAIHEQGSPEITRTLPLVAISGSRSWSDVNRIFLGYISGKAIPGIALREKTEKLIENCQYEEQKIDALYRFVCSEVEDSRVILPASYALEQLSGNRVVLLLTMLRAAGIEADYALVREPGNLMAPPLWQLPTPTVFTRSIVRAKTSAGDTLWLDTRFKYNKMGALPEDIAGGTAFVVRRNGGEFINLPVAPQSEYTVSSIRTLKLDQKTIYVSGSVVLPGLAGLSLKEKLAGADTVQRMNVAENLLNGQKRGLELLEVNYPQLQSAGKPFKVEYRGEYFGMLKLGADGQRGVEGLFMPPPLLPERDNSRNRQTSYHLDRFVSLDDTLVLELPAGAKMDKIPHSLLIKNKFGYYQLNWMIDGSRVVARRQCEFKPQIIQLEDWNKYRNMALEIQQAEQHLLWWR